MHEIPPLAEQLLRAQGVTDAEFEELRRTGTLKRADPSGATIDISIDAQGSATMQQGSFVSVDGISLNGASIPPEALEKLRQYHKFMPDHVIQNIELATGLDIDGDGQIGGGGSNPAPPTYGTAGAGAAAVASAPAMPASGAMPVVDPSHATADGPFVERRVGTKLIPIVLGIVVAAGIVFLLVR